MLFSASIHCLSSWNATPELFAYENATLQGIDEVPLPNLKAELVPCSLLPSCHSVAILHVTAIPH